MSRDIFQQMRDVQFEYDSAQQQDAFQERIVKQLLRYANVKLHVGRAKAEAKRNTGYDSLNFLWFHREFGFPVHLLAQKMPFTSEARLADLYGQGGFKKLPWWKEYESQVDGMDLDLVNDRVALVFNLPKARDAFLMVLHNQPTQSNVVLVDAENRVDEPWPRTTFPLGKNGVVAVLESFKSFMQTVGTDWADQWR